MDIKASSFHKHGEFSFTLFGSALEGDPKVGPPNGPCSIHVDGCVAIDGSPLMVAIDGCVVIDGCHDGRCRAHVRAQL